MSGFFSKVNNALGNVGNYLSSLNIKGIGNSISKGLNSVDKWIGENKGTIGNIMSTVGTLGQLIPGGKVGDKIRSFANTVSNVGSALGGRSLIAPTVNQTGTNNPANNGHNILGTMRPANTPRVTGPQTPQQFGTTPTQAPVGLTANAVRARGGFGKII